MTKKAIFQKVPRPEIFDTTLRGEPYKLLHIIRQRCGGKKTCWPSYERLALDMGIKDHRTIKKHLGTLSSKGLLAVSHQEGKPNILTPSDIESHYGDRNFMSLPGVTPPSQNAGGTDNTPPTKNEGTPPTKNVPDPLHRLPAPPTKNEGGSKNKEERLKEERLKEEPREAEKSVEEPKEDATRIFKLFEEIFAQPPLRGTALDDHEAIETHINRKIEIHGFDAVFKKSNEVLIRTGIRPRDIRYLMTADGKGGALISLDDEDAGKYEPDGRINREQFYAGLTPELAAKYRAEDEGRVVANGELF